MGIVRRLGRVPSWNQAAVANWPGIAALVAAIQFGSHGSGIMPGQDGLPKSGWGIAPLEARGARRGALRRLRFLA